VFCLMRHLIAKRDLQAMVRKKLAYLFDAVFMSPARDFADNDWIYAVLSTGAGAMGGASVLLAPPASSLLGQVSRRLVGCAGDVILACSLRCLINQCIPADLCPAAFEVSLGTDCYIVTPNTQLHCRCTHTLPAILTRPLQYRQKRHCMLSDS
jgi:hypothetical protein